MADAVNVQRQDQADSARPSRRGPTVVIIIASILLLLAVFAVWANRQLLETDSWVDTSTELLANEEIQAAVSTLLVDALYDNVDVEAQLSERLPPDVQGLAGPLSAGLRELATTAAREILATAPVQDLWREANRTAHEAFVTVVEGGDGPISVEDGTVTLDLRPMVEELSGRVGITLPGVLPEDAGQIEILQSDEISAVQTGVDLLTTVVWILVILSLGLFGLAIWWAKTWRREALRASCSGFGCERIPDLLK